jgi:hypothetical protein
MGDNFYEPITFFIVWYKLRQLWNLLLNSYESD